jgi:putative endonuclease
MTLASTWYVYMLRCADNSLYTGVTTDLDKRLRQHNGLEKNGAKYTRARRPVNLALQETCPDRATAQRREAEIKQLSKADKELLVASRSP